MTESKRSQLELNLDKYLVCFMSPISSVLLQNLSNRTELPNGDVSFLLGECYPAVSDFMDTVKGVRLRDQQSGAVNELEIPRIGETGASIVVESLIEIVLESEFKGFAYTIKNFSKIYYQLYLQGRLHLLADQFPEILPSGEFRINTFEFMSSSLEDLTRVLAQMLQIDALLYSRDIQFLYVQIAARLVGWTVNPRCTSFPDKVTLCTSSKN